MSVWASNCSYSHCGAHHTGAHVSVEWSLALAFVQSWHCMCKVLVWLCLVRFNFSSRSAAAHAR